MKEGILTLLGITDETDEITTLDIIRTKVVASPIPKPFIADVVVPSVGHIPSKRTNMGFSLIIPLVIKFSLLIAYLL
ncbi:hypothetical protein SDC9_113300 [bioreactor metagenome]|uniref:Uncharacterized protein n=1 Tax=bioreactor metagenome TaxID=1076179 RepID=A0A645BT23_9ZZZZ